MNILYGAGFFLLLGGSGVSAVISGGASGAGVSVVSCGVGGICGGWRESD